MTKKELEAKLKELEARIITLEGRQGYVVVKDIPMSTGTNYQTPPTETIILN